MQETAEPRGACRDGVRSRSLRHLPAAASAPAARERGLPAPVASLAAAAAAQAPQPPPPPTLHLLLHRPAALLSLVPRELAMFVAGGVAGAIAKTTTAPLDRVRGILLVRSAAADRTQVKILMQVSSVNTGAVQSAAQTAAKGGIVAAFKAIAKSEGVLGFWRGNGPQARGRARAAKTRPLTRGRQVLRVLPYSACQLYRRVSRMCSASAAHAPQLRETEKAVCGQGRQPEHPRAAGRGRRRRLLLHSGACLPRRCELWL